VESCGDPIFQWISHKPSYNLGCILLKQKEYKEALANFAQVIKINPDYRQAYNHIGIILVQKGKFKKAKKFFSKAVQIDPDYSEALKNVKILNQIKE
jgi:tetratricopeptide (TPR) repeat protein